MVFHVEVNFGGLPFIAEFVEHGGDQAQEGGFIGEEAGDAGAAFEFLVDPLQGVAGAQSGLVGERQGEDGEALGQIDFQTSLKPGFWQENGDKFKSVFGRL